MRINLPLESILNSTRGRQDIQLGQVEVRGMNDTCSYWVCHNIVQHHEHT